MRTTPVRAVLMAFVAIAGALSIATPAQAIRGGTPVDAARDYPWAVVSTRPGSAHPYKESCVGTLLSPTIFITAGHCTMKVELWSARTVIVGRTDMADTSVGVEVKPVDAWLHPEYSSCNEGFQCGDIGIWVLERPVGSQYLQLATAADEAVGTVTTLVSWGQTGGGQNTSVSLKGEFPITSEQPCKDKGYDFKTGKILCLGPVNGSVGTCVGDSGGGYFAGNKLIAVHSGGDSSCNGPSLAMKISDQAANIQKIIDGNGAASGWRHLGTGQPPANDFSVTASPTSGSVDAGQSATVTVATATTAGSAQTVNLTASGLPSGVTASFNPGSVQSGGSSTLTLATAASTVSGTYPVTITGTGAVARSATYSLTVRGTTPPAPRTFTSTQFYFIPDPGSVDSPITTTATGNAASTVTVVVRAGHWCSSELAVTLIAPNGTQHVLKPSGGACASYTGGTYTVTGVVSPAAGVWKLRATDSKAWNFGSLSGWTITL